MDRLRCAVHVAAERGHLAIFRAFVHIDPCCIYTADGIGLKPLNIALRNKQKDVVSFLLSKQWSTVPYGSSNQTVSFGSSQQTLPLYVYAKLKKWAKRARETALEKNSSIKSSLKVFIDTDEHMPQLLSVHFRMQNRRDCFAEYS